MAFVLVQHLDPHHKSILTEILARETAMPVKEVQEGMVLEPNQVFVMPSNKHIHMRHGVLHLVSRTELPGRFMPIDHFLRSLAVDQKARAIAVILSGADADGAGAL